LRLHTAECTPPRSRAGRSRRILRSSNSKVAVRRAAERWMLTVGCQQARGQASSRRVSCPSRIADANRPAPTSHVGTERRAARDAHRCGLAASGQVGPPERPVRSVGERAPWGMPARGTATVLQQVFPPPVSDAFSSNRQLGGRVAFTSAIRCPPLLVGVSSRDARPPPEERQSPRRMSVLEQVQHPVDRPGSAGRAAEVTVQIRPSRPCRPRGAQRHGLDDVAPRGRHAAVAR